MKAVIWPEYGAPDVLQIQNIERPVPKENEILVRVIATTVFAGDCEMRGSDFPIGFKLPIRLMFGLRKPRKAVQIPGQEIAGIIESVGSEITTFKKGDEIFAPAERFGAHAEYVCLREKNAIAIKPVNMTFEEAATVSVGGLNALHFVRKGKVVAGNKVLIHGAGGGIGTFAIQIARSMGAEVTALDSTKKLAILQSLGAHHVIDYTREDFSETGKTYDVIIDVAGKAPYDKMVRSLTPEGRLVLGNPRLSTIARSLVTSIMGKKKVILVLTRYRTEDLLELKKLIESGKLGTIIDKRFSLEQIVEAHRYVETGQKTGHVVINVQPEVDT